MPSDVKTLKIRLDIHSVILSLGHIVSNPPASQSIHSIFVHILVE